MSAKLLNFINCHKSCMLLDFASSNIFGVLNRCTLKHYVYAISYVNFDLNSNIIISFVYQYSVNVGHYLMLQYILGFSQGLYCRQNCFRFTYYCIALYKRTVSMNAPVKFPPEVPRGYPKGLPIFK